VGLTPCRSPNTTSDEKEQGQNSGRRARDSLRKQFAGGFSGGGIPMSLS